MNTQCLKCHSAIISSWRFCPVCGDKFAPEAEESMIHHDPEPAPVADSFGGLAIAMVTIPLLVVVGSLLTITGFGAPLGIPMIIAAIFLPLAGPMFGMNRPHHPK